MILLFLGNGTFAYLWWMEKTRANTTIVEKEQVIVERDNVKSDLLELQQEYATLQTSDKGLQAELDAKKEREYINTIQFNNGMLTLHLFELKIK